MSTAKEIGKRLKLKGLQRLRWYCQMCEKQCRDENGFKNHCTSDNHLRQMERFSTKAHEYTEKFSREFEKQFMDCLSRHHVNRIGANYVYNEMIQNKQHVHMNSTRWDSLASFVRYLGETGRCEVEQDSEDEKWYLRWIDPVLEQRKVLEAEKDRQEAKRLKRMEEMLVKQVGEVRSAEQRGEEEEEDDLDGEMLSKLVTSTTQVSKPKQGAKLAMFASEAAAAAGDQDQVAVVDDHDDDDAEKQGWLLPNLIVRICSKKVKGFVNEKAVVSEVFANGNRADLIVLKSGAELFQVEAKRLETVVPTKGRVVVCNPSSKIRGSVGTVVSANAQVAQVQFETNSLSFPLEDVCKLFEDDEEE